MKELEFDIEIIKDYIDGKLPVGEALEVEHMIAINEQWQDVYLGLTIADDLLINSEEQVKRIKKSLPMGKLHTLPTTFSQNTPWVRVISLSAALILILLGSVFVFKQIGPRQQNRFEYSAKEANDFSSDQVQILMPSTKKKETKRINLELLEDYDPSLLEVEPLVDFSSNQISKSIKEINSPRNYQNTLRQYGYHKVGEPTVYSSPIGASAPEFFNETDTYFSGTNALTLEEKEKIEKDVAENYIARFPFHGQVSAIFRITPDAKVTDFLVIESPGIEESKAIQTMVVKKINWNAPKTEDGSPRDQKVKVTADFGNTVSLHIQFME